MAKKWKNVAWKHKERFSDDKNYKRPKPSSKKGANKMRGKSTLNYACSPVTIIKAGVKTVEPSEDLENMSYVEYLKSRYWLILRQKIISRDKKKCRFCNSRRSLQVHHKLYRGRGKEKEKDLITLCKKCHENEHGINKIKIPSWSILKSIQT